MLTIAKRNLGFLKISKDLLDNSEADKRLSEKVETITGGSGLTRTEVLEIVDNAIAQNPSGGLSSELADKLNKAYVKPANGIPASDLAAGVVPSLSGLETSDHAQQTYLPKGNYAAAEHTHSQYLTEHQSLANYALKSELPEAYDDSSLRTLIEAKQDKGDYLTESSLSDYAKKSEIPELYDDTSIKSRLSTLEEVDHTLFAKNSDLQSYYTKDEVSTLINNLLNLTKEIVDNLPTENIKSNCIYLVLNSDNVTDESDIYNEYLYINNKWEKIGTTKLDLSGYATESWVEGKNYLTEQDITGKQDALSEEQLANIAKANDVAASLNDLNKRIEALIARIEALELVNTELSNVLDEMLNNESEIDVIS